MTNLFSFLRREPIPTTPFWPCRTCGGHIERTWWGEIEHPDCKAKREQREMDHRIMHPIGD